MDVHMIHMKISEQIPFRHLQAGETVVSGNLQMKNLLWGKVLGQARQTVVPGNLQM